MPLSLTVGNRPTIHLTYVNQIFVSLRIIPHPNPVRFYKRKLMRHLMLDIETLGVNPGCIVLSIGAVEFSNGVITGRFHAHIDPHSCEEYGLKAEAGTTMWWLAQDQKAQQALLSGEQHDLDDVLASFIDTFDWKDLKVWANGASFDFPILKAAFEAVDRKLPWAFYNEMDFRTIKGLMPKADFDTMRVRPGVAHDALDDATAQAQTLIKIFELMQQGGPLRVAA